MRIPFLSGLKTIGKASFITALSLVFANAARAEYYVVYPANEVVVYKPAPRVVYVNKCHKPHKKTYVKKVKKRYYARSSYKIEVYYVPRVYTNCGCGNWMPSRWEDAPVYYYEEPVRRPWPVQRYYYAPVDQDMATGDDDIMSDPDMNNQY